MAITSFIFSIVSVAFLGVWGMQVRSVEKSRHHLVASLLAEELIEESMAEGYERTSLTPPGEDPKPVEIPMEMEFRNARGEWSVIQVKYTTTRLVKSFGSDDDKLKQVVVEVTWDDSTHVGKITLETYLAGVI